MADTLTCRDCGARAPADASRCPACGSRALQGPPDFLARRPVLAIVYGVVTGVIVLFLAGLVMFFVGRSQLGLPMDPAQRQRAMDRQLDAIRDAERTLPPVPNAQRLEETHGTSKDGLSRTLASCWTIPATQTPAAPAADYTTVRQLYADSLATPGSPWRPLGGSGRAYRNGHVSLLINPPSDARPPCPGTYQLFFAYTP